VGAAEPDVGAVAAPTWHPGGMLSTSRRAAALVLVVTVAGACGGESESETEAVDPVAQLTAAKEILDDAASVSLSLDGDPPSGGTVITEAAGTVVPPASFDGELGVSQSGIELTVPVVSVDGTLWVQLPFTSSFTEIDPTDYGIPDPGALLDPDTGLSTLLLADPAPTAAGEERLGQEVLDVVRAEIPAATIQQALPFGVPATDVVARFGIEPTSEELRLVVLSGDFYQTSQDTTYRLVLDDYDAPVTIEPPD
jgi:hypothetical protein